MRLLEVRSIREQMLDDIVSGSGPVVREYTVEEAMMPYITFPSTRKPEPVPLGELISDLQQGDESRAAMFAKKASKTDGPQPVPTNRTMSPEDIYRQMMGPMMGQATMTAAANYGSMLTATAIGDPYIVRRYSSY